MENLLKNVDENSNKDMVFVNHITNKTCYKKIVKSGYIGLDQDDYNSIRDEIISLFDPLTVKQVNLLKKKYFLNGDFNSVSFWPYQNNINPLLLSAQYKYGGEFLGTETKRLLKSIARMLKCKYNDLYFKDIILQEYAGINTNPVVMNFKIPKNLFNNYSDYNYRNNIELYTCNKISMSYFLNYKEYTYEKYDNKK